MGAKKLFDHSAFLTAKIHINLRNLVSQTIVASNVKTIGDYLVTENSGENLIQLLEILPNGMVLSVPNYTCAEGHQLEIEIKVSKLSKKPYGIKLQGKVKNLENSSANQNRITVELKAYSEEKWVGFCKLFSDKQEDILDFLEKIRGY